MSNLLYDIEEYNCNRKSFLVSNDGNILRCSIVVYMYESLLFGEINIVEVSLTIHMISSSALL